MNKVRVRFPPSPTGIPHIGNTRTALYNFLFARHNKGSFVLRIEDTDQKRLVPGAREAILEILEWLGIKHDEFYVQSERLDLYKEHTKILLDKKLAYEKDGAVWVKVPGDKTFAWDDAVGKKHISFNGKDIEDFVILKSDGFPTYHLANIVDDHLMEISHVIRGEEWISSTPKHLYLYEAFSWQPPSFAHLPVILGQDKEKLSKRYGAKTVLELRDEGFLPEAVNNFMALLGWSPGGDREIMSMEEMTQLFKLEDVNTSCPIFDNTKLLWMNGEYIRKTKNEDLKAKISQILGDKFKKIDQETLDKLLELAKDRMKTLQEFEGLVEFVLQPQKPQLDDNEQKIAEKLKSKLSILKNWNAAAILDVLRQVLKEEGIKMSVLYKIFTGKTSGLPLPETLEILGREKALSLMSS